MKRLELTPLIAFPSIYLYALPNKNSIRFLPNPFLNQTTILFNEPVSHANSSVYNTFGTLIKQTINFSRNTFLLNRNVLLSGIYFAVLTDKAGSSMTKKLLLLTEQIIS